MGGKPKEDTKKEQTEEEKAYELEQEKKANSKIYGMPDPSKQPGVKETVKEMVDSFGQMAFT